MDVLDFQAGLSFIKKGFFLLGFRIKVVFVRRFVEGDDISLEEGLNRELHEEIGLKSDNAKFNIKPNDYFYSSVNHTAKLVLHFYVKEVSLDDFECIEQGVLESIEYGAEVMGIVRPPLFETDKGRGFVDFMRNQFVGNSLVQLLRALEHLHILSIDEIVKFINKV